MADESLGTSLGESLGKPLGKSFGECYGRFVIRCEKRIPNPNERKGWVATCVQFAVKDTIRAKSTFGYESASNQERLASAGRHLDQRTGTVLSERLLQVGDGLDLVLPEWEI